MSEFDGIKRTRIQEQPIVNPNATRTQSFFDIAAEAQSMQAEFANEAKQEASDAGRLAGQNSVSINSDGSITRALVPDAGRYYTKDFVSAQRVAAKSSLESSIRLKAQEFIGKNKNNPDAAADFNEEFKVNYLEPLLDGMNPDIRGQVEVVAHGVFMGTLNHLSELEMARSHKDGQAVYEFNSKRDLSALEQMRAQEGMEKQAEALEQKIYGDAQDAHPQFLTMAGIEQLNVSIIAAKESGNLIRETDKMSLSQAVAHIAEFKKKTLDGLGIADMAKIAAEAESRVAEKSRVRSIQESEYERLAKPKILAAEVLLAEIRMNAPQGGIVTPASIKEIMQKTGLDEISNTVPSVKVWEIKQLVASKEEQDELIAATYKDFAFYKISDVASGKTAYGDLMLSDAWQHFDVQDRHSLYNAHLVKLKADLKENEVNDLVTVEKMIRAGDFVVGDLHALMEGPSTQSKFFRDNRAKITTYINSYHNSDAFKYRAGNIALETTNYVPKSLRTSRDAWNLSNNYGGTFNANDEAHQQTAIAESVAQRYVSPYVVEAFGNWRELVLDQKTALWMVNTAKVFSKSGNSTLLEQLPAEFSDPKILGQIQGMAVGSEEDYVTSINKWITGNNNSSADAVDLVAKAEEFVNGIGFFGGDSFSSGLTDQLDALSSNSDMATTTLADIVGQGGPFRRLYGANGIDVPKGMDGVPKSIRGLINSPEFKIGSEAAVSRLKDIARGLILAGHPEHKVTGMALDIYSESGAGISATASPGNHILVDHSYEKTLENAGVTESPRRVTQAVLSTIADQIQAASPIKGADFGADWWVERAFSRDFEMFWEMFTEDGTQQGILEGGDLGGDLAENIMNEGRFEQAWNDGKVQIKSYNKDLNAFEVFLTLGAKDAGGEPIKMRLKQLIRIDQGVHALVSRKIIEKELGKGAVHRFVTSPAAALSPLAPGQYNAGETEMTMARFRELQSAQTQMVMDHEKALKAARNKNNDQ